MNKYAKIISDIKDGKIGYQDITKKDMWVVLKESLTNPSLGIRDEGTNDSLMVELQRIIDIFTSVDNANYQQIIEEVCANLSYDTFLVLHQMFSNHMNLLLTAKSITGSFPGEISSLGDKLNDIGEKVLSEEIDINDETVSLSVLFAMNIMRYLNDIYQSSNQLNL